MNPNIIATLSICAYLASTTLVMKRLFPNNSAKSKMAALLCSWTAVALHSGYIAFVIHQNAGFNFSFFSTASLISMIVSLLLLLAAIGKPVEILGIFLFPVTALMLGMDTGFPEKQRTLDIHNWEMNTHILSSIIAFSLLNIAALQAILLAFQNQQLKSHPPKRYIKSMPPLQTMELLLFQMIGVGLFFLTISLVTGFIFLDDIFAQHLAHKTILSIAAWLIFSGLLIGRSRYGWRGRTAIKWTLWGFMFLLLAYFGSKLVLELILKR